MDFEFGSFLLGIIACLCVLLLASIGFVPPACMEALDKNIKLQTCEKYLDYKKEQK